VIRSAELSKFDSNKVYKIKYSINLLPYIGQYLHKEIDPYTKEVTKSMANEDVNLLSICCESEELDMFASESLIDCIEFKWNQFGQNWHFIGFFLHLVYIVILIMYTDQVYIKKAEEMEEEAAIAAADPENAVEHDDEGELRNYSIMLLAGIIYPLVYESN